MTTMMRGFLFLMTITCTGILPAQNCPQLLGAASTPAQAWGIAVSGNYAYLADKEAGLLVYDVSVPTAPVRVAAVATPDAAEDVAVAGSYAYVADNMSGLLVYNISNPAAPALVSNVNMMDGDYVYYVFISGHYAYATGSSTVYVIDILNPPAPVMVGSLAAPGYTHNCAIKGNILYVAAHNYGVLIVDVSNPSSPSTAGTITGFTIAHGIAVSGNYLYVVDYWISTLHVFDISTPTSPEPLAVVSTVSTPSQVAVSGALALVAVQNTTGNGALQIFNIADNSAPFQAGIAGTSYSEDVVAAGTRAFVADGNAGMKVFDFSACSGPPGSQYFIPAAAKIAGGSGTNWMTDVVLHNPGTAAVTAALYYLVSGGDNSGAAAHSVTVNAAASLKLPDIVGSLFGMGGTSGAIRIVASAPLLIGSRTYNDQGASGTYGQSIDGLSADTAFGTLNQPHLIQLAKNAAYRTNMGFVNTTAASLTLNVYLYSGADSSQIGSRSIPLAAYEHVQENNIIQDLTAADVDDAYAVITTQTNGSRYFAYASVVDNRTGDPTYIPAR
jgi:hypothetical protein